MSDDSIENSKSRKGFRAFVRNTVSKNINGVIFPSQAVCEWYRENISVKTKTFELPIIHEDEKFRNLLVESLNTANKNIWDFGLKDKRIILFVGRLVEVKNLSFLINVVSQIKSTDWVLVMVGDGFLMNDLKAQAVISGISDRTYFVGRKEGVELVCWYTIAQIFVLPSTYERYGAVVNEALLAGCRVLCSELAGASVLINENNGELFNPYNENEFLNCIVDSLGKSIMTHGKITKIRESQMPFTFNEKVEKLLSAL